MKIKTISFTGIFIVAFLSVKSQYTPPSSRTTSNNSSNTPSSNSNNNPSSTPTGYSIAISIGGAIPLGTISDRANFGGHFDLSSQIPINHSNFGIAIKLDGQDNPYNIQAYLSAANSSGPVLRTATADDFVSADFLIGGFATIPVNRFSFDFRLMFGTMSCDYPNITTYDYYGNSYQLTFQATTVFAYNIGAGARYNLSKKLTLMLNWNYISGSSATFTGTETTGFYPRNISITKQFAEFTSAWGIGWIL